MKVVVLDDDQFVREFVARLLERAGHDVEEYDDAAPALTEVDFTDVDLVITDLQMPTSGEVAVRTLRQRQLNVPIIVMSGFIQPEKIDYLLQMGARAVLIKPFSIDEFEAVVKRVLEGV